MMLKVLDLFSGIGGFSLGLERTGGFKTVAFCEIEEFPRRVLAKHWPGVPIHRDVRELKAEHVGAIDVICGGFPCQDISYAGKGAGLAGERSGLWREYARLIGEIRPAYVIVENVSALLRRGLDIVLGDLAALGYDAEWHCIPAAAVGAPHIRDRIWLVAYPQHPDADSLGPHRATVHQLGDAELRDEQVCVARSMGAALADADRSGLEGRDREELRECASERLAGPRHPLAHTARLQPGRQEQRPIGQRVGEGGQPIAAANADSLPTRRLAIAWGECGQWLVEPDVGRVAHGVPARVDRLRGLGNAVVPQIPEIIGRAILVAESREV